LRCVSAGLLVRCCDLVSSALLCANTQSDWAEVTTGLNYGPSTNPAQGQNLLDTLPLDAQLLPMNLSTSWLLGCPCAENGRATDRRSWGFSELLLAVTILVKVHSVTLTP
jgi:hypothetical protein